MKSNKRFCFSICNMLVSGLVIIGIIPFATNASEDSCFSHIKYAKPMELRAKRGLYILIDETVPLSKAMKAKVEHLLQGWGKQGDLVKIARFSASYRGLYPELLFSQKIESMPDKAFLYNLHYRDKKLIKNCLEEQKAKFNMEFGKQLKAALKNINPKIPKSELLGSLKQLSKKLVVPDEALEKTVFLISDGLQNSSALSFYSNKKLKNIKPRPTIAKLRRKGMLGYWNNTKVYMYGVGLMPDKKRYTNPKVIHNLKQFWERYFVEGGAKVKEIGTPELLLTSIE